MRDTKVILGLLLVTFTFCSPASAQLSGTQQDPLARIRDAAKGNVQACSATGETLCEQVAPKIVDAAEGESPIAENLRRLTEDLGGRLTGAAATARAVAWGVAAFRDAGVEVHTEKFVMSVSRTEGTSQEENVVAEIRGREKPDEWVLLAAHLDPSDLAAGAFDEKCNAALVIEAARDIQVTGIRPRRSIRFVLFTGQGQQMHGSWEYVRAHRAELDRARAVIVFAAGANPVNGYILNGRHDIEPGLREALKPIDSMGFTEYTYGAPLETDSFDFLVEGIPTIVAAAHASAASGRGTVSNSLDKPDIKELKRNTAIAAVTAFGIAEREAPLGPRQSRAEIESLLKVSGLDKQMKTAGLWPLWESGERGISP